MIIGITGTRYANKTHTGEITQALLKVINLHTPSAIINGGAKGADLMSLIISHCLREGIENESEKYKLITILPDNLTKVGRNTASVIEDYSDEVIELNLEITAANGWVGFRKRNEEIVNRSDLIMAFPNDSFENKGTAMTTNMAYKKGIPVIITKLG